MKKLSEKALSSFIKAIKDNDVFAFHSECKTHSRPLVKNTFALIARCIEHQRVDMLLFLLQEIGMSPNAWFEIDDGNDPCRVNAVALAAEKDSLELVNALLAAGANPNGSDSSDVAPLVLVCQYCINRRESPMKRFSKAVATRLIEMGARYCDVHSLRPYCNRNFLFPGAEELLKIHGLLLPQVDDIDEYEKYLYDDYPIATATKKLDKCEESLNLLKRLLAEDKLTLDECDLDNKTGLMWAIDRNWLDAANLLLDQGADIGFSEDGEPALYLAMMKDNGEAIKLLVQRGANVDMHFDSGKTCLGFAAFFGKKNAVEALLECGADWSAVNDDGQSALMDAVEYASDLDVVKLLVARGGEKLLCLRNNEGRTALDIAVNNINLTDIAEFLKAASPRDDDIPPKNKKLKTK